MTRSSKFLALFAGSALALAGTGFAAQSKTPAPAKQAKAAPKAMTSVTQGTIKSISDSQIVVERKVKGAEKDLTLVLNSDTQKQGDLKVGDHVTVHYRLENMQDTATLVKGSKGSTVKK